MSGVCFSRSVAVRRCVGGLFGLAYEAFTCLVDIPLDSIVFPCLSIEVGIDHVGVEQDIVIRKFGSIESKTCYIACVVVILFLKRNEYLCRL